MTSHPLTASERRGILIVAIISLLISGGGLFVSRCGGGEGSYLPGEAEVLYDPADGLFTDGEGRESASGSVDSLSSDSVAPQSSIAVRGQSADPVVKNGKRSSRKKPSASGKSERIKKQPKVYRRRSPIDEEV